MRPRWLLSMVLAACSLLFFEPSSAARGDWDAAYGNAGRVAMSFPAGFMRAGSWPLADGSRIFHGRMPLASGLSGVNLVHLNADGSPDNGFGVVNLRGLGVQNDPDAAIRLVLQSDGKFVVMTQNHFGTGDTVVVSRFHANGVLDTSFGSGGFVNFTLGDQIASALALDRNGSILAAIRVVGPGTDRMTVTRLSSSGAVDTTFGVGGAASLQSPDAPITVTTLRQADDGSLVLGGSVGTRPAVGRLTAAGVVDETFGVGGIRVLDLADGSGGVIDVAVSSDGGITALGRYDDQHLPRGYLSFVARVTATGTVDPTFGSGGRVALRGYVESMLVEADRGIVVSGFADDANRGRLAWLARFNEDGSPDVSFGLRGETLVDFSLPGAFVGHQEIWDISARTGGGFAALAFANQDVIMTRFLGVGASAGAIGISLPLAPGLAFESGVAPVRLFVYRAGGASGRVTVQYRVVSGVAIAGEDVEAATGTVTFEDGEIAPKLVEIKAIDDDQLEDREEEFTVELFAPTGGATLSRTSVVAKVYSDDEGSRVSFPTTEVNVLEGAGIVKLRVLRDMDLRGPLTITYGTLAGTASAGADFTPVTGTLSWAAGEGGLKTIELPILDDADDEQLESFSVVLSNPSRRLQSSRQDSANIRISSDDVTTGQVVALPVTETSVSESAGSVSITVRRLGSSSDPMSVSWQTVADSATANQDFTSASGTLSWSAGDLAPKTITVAINDDAIGELEETFRVNLTTLGAAYPITGMATSVRIIDNDLTPTTPLINIACPATIAESAGVLTCTFTPTSMAYTELTMSFGGQGGTASGKDVQRTISSLSWSPGNASAKTIAFNIVDDNFKEADETVIVFLSASNGAQLAASKLEFTILDDDPSGMPEPYSGLRLSSDNLRVSESDRIVRVGVSRGSASMSSLSMIYSVTPGTASSPDDFLAVSGTLYWPDGDVSDHFIDVQLNGDQRVEADETFQVWLGGLSTTITIIDDDAGGSESQVAFVTDNYAVDESASTVTLQVSRVGDTRFAASVNYAAVAGSAGTSDFAPANGTVTWEAGDASQKNVVITLLPDSASEGSEVFTVVLSAPSAGARIERGTATVTISDDDSPAVPGSPASGSGGGNSGSGRGGGGGAWHLGMLLLLGLLSMFRNANVAFKARG